MVRSKVKNGINVSNEESNGTTDIVEVNQRMSQMHCPTLCNRFTCMLEGHCNMECKKLDIAKATICDLCIHDCTETQKKILLDTNYYQEKKKEITRNILDGVKDVKERHHYLETRYAELKREMLLAPGWRIFKKLDIRKEGSRIRYELELTRKIMDTLEIPYKKEVDLEG